MATAAKESVSKVRQILIDGSQSNPSGSSDQAGY
jgi:hypothetical protein